jgi:phosphatidylserine/phosphatidylglycerophosphate/cardiolipin synthase-like enzyme
MTDAIAIRTLTDGGQDAADVAAELAAFIAEARSALAIAQYDFHLAPATAAVLGGAIRDAAARGVAVRIVYDVDHANPVAVPPPPEPDAQLIASLGVPSRAIAGVPDLMHHKYVVRDGDSVLTGSTNWTDDSWTRQENLIATVLSPELATAYARNFEELWSGEAVAETGDISPSPVSLAGVEVRPWFTPRHGEDLSARIGKAIATARRRVRICSPVITAAPVLSALAQVVSEGRVNVAGCVDVTQVREVISQWHANGNAAWKLPLLQRALSGGFSGKASTPWTPRSVHDFMHAKATVADDVVFIGSFNLSRSGEQNAENVLEIADAGPAEQLAAYVDGVRARYPALAF